MWQRSGVLLCAGHGEGQSGKVSGEVGSRAGRRKA